MGRILVAVDIESTGALFSHPVNSIGFTVGDMNGNILERKKFNIAVKWFKMTDGKMDYGDFEPRCVDEFWSQLSPEIISRCFTPEPEKPEYAWKNIASWINCLELKYPLEEGEKPWKKFIFVSDNASFDIAKINYGLERYANRLPMRFSTTKKYRSVISADDMLDMLPKEKYEEVMARINSMSIHDHDCLNDSHNIYLQGVEALKRGH